MKRISSALHEVKILGHVLPALLFGASLGVFVHGYWLADFFPVGSKSLLFLTILTSLLGMAGYILLFLWVTPALQDLSTLRKVGVVGASLLAGIFLFFTVTANWQKPARYISLFLPSHTLEISIPPEQNTNEISILWITTSLGDISYDIVEYKGWDLKEDKLVLTNGAENSLRWVGKTGEEVQIVFDVPSRDGYALLSWDGNEETLQFSKKRYPYVHAFDIPFYASHRLILLLGVLNFALFALPLCLLVWKKREEMLRAINQSFTFTSQRIDDHEWLVVLAVIILAFALRAPNLEILFPSVEEYSHLNAAKQIIQGAPIESVYQRSMWLVTVPVSIMFRVFGYELWAARLLGVIFNVLAVIPLYLLARKMNRPVAILSVLLFATSPWVIAISRVVREYAYYPFYFFLIVYGMILFLEQIPDRFRVDRDWKVILKPRVMLLGLALAIPLYYAVCYSTTFALILIAYVALGFFAFLKFDLQYRKNLFVILIMMGFALWSAYIWRGRLFALTEVNLAPLDYFFLNPPQQWYFDRTALLPVMGLLGTMLLAVLVRRANILPLFFVILYSGSMAYFMFSSSKFFAPRHLTTTQLWYVVLVAVGLYLIWIFLQTFPSLQGNYGRVATVLVLTGLVINFKQVLVPLTSPDPSMPITTDYHDDLTDLQAFMLAHVNTEDVMISSRVYSRYVEWVGSPIFQEVYEFRVGTTKDDVFSIVDQHDSGWIVIDDARIERAVFSPDVAFLDNDKIEYVGLFDGEHVWQWRTK